MPPRKEAPPAYFLQENGKFKCTKCNTKWLKTWREHVGSKKHVLAAGLEEERNAANERTREVIEAADAAMLNARTEEALYEDFYAADDHNAAPVQDAPRRFVLPTADDLVAAHAWNEAGQGEDLAENRAHLQHLNEQLILDTTWLQTEGFNVDADDDAGAANGDESEDDDADEAYDIYPDLQPAQSNWFPYPNKTWAYLDFLSSFQRLRLSNAQLRMILYTMKQLGCPNVPALKQFRSFQKKLRAKCAVPTAQQTSELGNVFFTNDICATFAMELANPRVAGHIHFYPETKPASISESWETTRWLEFPWELLTPMVRVGTQHFYVNEVAQLVDGSYVLPLLWHKREGVLVGTCIPFTLAAGVLNVETAEEQHVPVESFARTFADLNDSGDLPRFHPALSALRDNMPNPLRAKADGLELYTVFLNAWADDVSGNVSKQYNKHYNVCLNNAGLPWSLLQQEFFVRLFSTSPYASTPEQLAALKTQVLSTHDTPYECFNALTGRRCKFRLVVQALPADNPQQSEHCSHMIGNANKNCRRCYNTRAAPTEPDAGNEWYIHSFEPRNLRTVEETRGFVKHHLELACRGEGDEIAAEQSEKGIKDVIAQYWIKKILAKAEEMAAAAERDPENAEIPRTDDEIAAALAEWLKAQPGDHYSPLLDWSGLDPHKDTPVEILHTILLGLIKYIWHGMTSKWKPEQDTLFAIRIEAADISGLDIARPRGSYLVQYKNNLIGRHFKALSQLATFQVHNIASPQQFALLKASGSLSAVLWFTEIEDMQSYLADLRILINNVLDAYGDIDPTRILVKTKLHLLEHLPDDIPRLGPAVRFESEIFECFNAIFRFCSVLSNHQAPSRDIARQLADMDRVKHIACGGYWFENGKAVQAGRNVVQIMDDHPIISKHFGWSPARRAVPGSVRPVSRRKATPRQFTDDEMECLSIQQPSLHTALLEADTEWIECVEVVSRTGDICKIGAWIVFVNSANQSRIGRIESVRTPDQVSGRAKPIVIVREYIVASARHPEFDMPFLKNADAPLQYIPPQDVDFAMNVQHDCRFAGCGPTGRRVVRQERTDTSLTAPTIEHTDLDQWIVNMHALHNAARLRKVLPRALTAPIPLYPDRKARLEDQATRALDRLVVKKAETNRKRAATRARKKAEKDAAKQSTAAADQPEPSANDVNSNRRPRKRRKTRHQAPASPLLEESSDGGDNDEEEDEDLRPATRSRTRKAPTRQNESDSQSEGDQHVDENRVAVGNQLKSDDERTSNGSDESDEWIPAPRAGNKRRRAGK